MVILSREETIILRQTQALKDIINAAGNKQPYTRQELERSFTEDYVLGNDYLKERGIPEIA